MASEWAMERAKQWAGGSTYYEIYEEEIAALIDEAYEKGVRESAEAMRFRLCVDSHVYGLSPIHEALKAAQEATGIELLKEDTFQ